MSQLRVLLTGPSGRIGPHIVPTFEECFDLHTFDLTPSSRPNSHVGSLQDLESLRAAMKGIDVVVHLAATSDEAPFLEQLVPNNIEGLYNLMTAAQLEGVRRVVFASSVQASWHLLQDAEKNEQPVETDVHSSCSLYGVTKVFGEVLGQYYHHHHNIEFVGIRLGWFERVENIRPNNWINNVWISPNDAAQLFKKAAEVPNVGFAIINGTSKTPKELLSLKSARELLNYDPQDFVREPEPVACG
ncbi:NAD(P)-dependent oxidoreductase [bacterium]|nr:MAG: NAD(P)-dependent oxidoreductase [bacterium]